ncbi:MAG: hypothetical protein V7707_07460 [Motiliproteus sp.]
MRRLYYLTDSVDCAEKVSDDLHRIGVTDWNFHIMSKNKKAMRDHKLNSASSFFHEHDGIRSAERGAIIGLIAGVLAIASFLLVAPDLAAEYRTFPLLSLLFTSGVLVAFGVFLGVIYGMDFENIKIKRFHKQLEEGQYLLMIDVKKTDADEIITALSGYADVTQAGEGHSNVGPFQTA